jgi:hypothetical protein
VRRDCEPHRGLLIYRLGGAAFVFGTLSVAGLPALVAIPLAAAAWRMARHDLAEMAAGRKDPAGRGLTAHGLSMARGAVALALLGLWCGACVLAFMYLKDPGW